MESTVDHFSAIRVFIRVVDSGSITRAAAQLNMPKSTASKLLAVLEADLNVRLLNRSTRAVSLTEEGARYYHEVAPLMQRLGDVETGLKEGGALPRGRLRVDVHSAMANSVLIPMLGEFRTLYPDIQLMLGISDRPISLVEEAADCVIRLGRLPDAALVARVLFEDRLVTCASPAYLASRGMPAAPADLMTGHDLVGYFSAATGAAQAIVLRRGDALHQIAHAQLLANDSTGQLGMLLAGLGIGQLFETTVRTHLATGALVQVLPDWETPTAPVSIVYPPSRRGNARVRLFIDWIVGRLGRDLPRAGGSA